MTRHSFSIFALVPAALALSGVLTSCSPSKDSEKNAGSSHDFGLEGGEVGTAQTQSLFAKYGGLPTVQTVIDQTVAAELADPTVAPFFAVIGTPGFDTADRLKSCLDLQLVALLGGPATYPGTSNYRKAPPEGYACRSMEESHFGLGITNEAFDRFVTIMTGVLQSNGFEQQDIKKIAPALLGLRSDIVTSEQKQR